MKGFLGKPRAARLPDEVRWVYQLLGRHGSIDYARAAARALGDAAARALEIAFAAAPEGDAKEFLRCLVRYTVTRDV